MKGSCESISFQVIAIAISVRCFKFTHFNWVIFLFLCRQYFEKQILGKSGKQNQTVESWKKESSHKTDSAESQEPMPYTGHGHGSWKSDSMNTNICAESPVSSQNAQQGYRPRVVKPYMRKQQTSTYSKNKDPRTFAIAQDSSASKSDHSTSTHVPFLLPTPLLKKKSSESSSLTTVNGQVPDFEGYYSNNMFGMKSSTCTSNNVTTVDEKIYSVQGNYGRRFEDRLLGTKSSALTSVDDRVPHGVENYGQHYMSEASVTNVRNVDRKNRHSDACFEGSNRTSVTNEQSSMNTAHSSSVTLVKPYVRKRKFVDES